MTAGAGEGVRILIVRLGSMGDIIHTLPAVAALRRGFPAATIGWAVEERWTALISTPNAIADPRGPEKPLVDVVHTSDTIGWRTALLSDETWREIWTTVTRLRGAHYDVALDFQGAFKSAVLAQLCGASRRIGFAQPREKPATLFYTHPVLARGRHIVEQNLSLVAALGVAADSNPPLFPLPCDPEAEQVCERELCRRGINEFAILNPGAGWGAKCWPAERYARVAQALGSEGLRSVVNFGPGEQQLARAVERDSGGAAVALACSLTELIALTRRARLFIGGDTGPTHLAAALGVPVVALFGPTDPARNGPYSNHNVVLRSNVSQTTSSHRALPEEGLLRITAEEVTAAARNLLEVCR